MQGSNNLAQICARLFEPEPKTGGNSNTGVNLKTVLNERSAIHEILDCSEEFLVTLKQLVNRVESLEMQQPQFIEFLCKKHIFVHEGIWRSLFHKSKLS